MGSIIEVIPGDDSEEVIRGEDVAGAAIAVDPTVGVEIAAAPHVDNGAGLRDDGAAGETHLFARDAACGDVIASGIDPGTAIEGNAEGNEDVSSGDRIIAGHGGDAVRSKGEKIGRGSGRGGSGDFVHRRGSVAIPAEFDRADGSAEGAVLANLTGVDAELSPSGEGKRTLCAAREGDSARSTQGIVGENVKGAKGRGVDLPGLEREITDHLEGSVAADVALAGIQVGRSESLEGKGADVDGLGADGETTRATGRCEGIRGGDRGEVGLGEEDNLCGGKGGGAEGLAEGDVVRLQVHGIV